MYEVLDHNEVKQFTREVMLQSAEVLRAAYPDDFTVSDLEDHIDDLIFRFRNRALRDTIFRVGQDLTRKLSSDDRFMGAIHLAMHYNLPYDKIVKAMSFGFLFRAKNEAGYPLPSDLTFLELVKKDFNNALTEILKLDPFVDQPVIEQLRKYLKIGRASCRERV